MKEMYVAPELEIVTFVPMEQLASGYLEGYASSLGSGITKNGGASGEVDVDIPIIDSSEGNP